MKSFCVASPPTFSLCLLVGYLAILLVFLFQGSSFADVIQMTDVFEGSIIRSARRLDEFLNQVT